MSQPRHTTTTTDDPVLLLVVPVTLQVHYKNQEPIGWLVFPWAAFLNHSCRPNCRVIVKGAVMRVVTNAAIKAGEELCISYIDDTLPVSRRRHLLHVLPSHPPIHSPTHPPQHVGGMGCYFWHGASKAGRSIAPPNATSSAA